MISKILRFGAVGAVALIFAACSKPPFQVIDLTPEGHRVSYSASKPMGCMLVGEKQGIARVGNTKASISQLKESAKNDAINNSAFLQQVGSGKGDKRLVVYISKEEWLCGKYETVCEDKEPKISDVSALKVYGEVYECKF